MDGPLYQADAGLYTRLCLLAQDGPVQWTDSPAPGCWLVTGHEEARTVLTRSDVFVSAFGTGPRSISTPSFAAHNWDPARPPFRSLNLSDPPFHTSLRETMEAWMSDRLRVIASKVRKLAQERVERAGPDLIADIAEPLPWEALGLLLTIPPAASQELLGLVKGIAFAGGAPAWRKAEEQLLQRLHSLNLNLPEQADETDRAYLARLLLLAGWASTRAALGNLLKALGQRVPGSVAHFCEETLRYSSPISRFGRLVVSPFRLGGQELAVGQRVLVIFPAVHRDARVFDRPHDFLVDRQPNEHLAFGAGPHACLGARLARAQLRWTAEAVMRRGGYHLVEADTPLPSAFTLGPARLIVRWRSGNERLQQ